MDLSSLHHIVWLLNSEVNFLFCLICKLCIMFCRYLDTDKTVFIWFSTAYGFRCPLQFLACVLVRKGGTYCVCLLATWTSVHGETEISVFEIPFLPASLEELFLALFSVSRTWKCGTDPCFPTWTLCHPSLSGYLATAAAAAGGQFSCPFAVLVSGVNSEALRTPSSALRDLSKQLSTQDS